jgi:hypothetical protein
MRDVEGDPPSGEADNEPGTGSESSQKQDDEGLEVTSTGKAEQSGGEAVLLAEMKALRRRTRTARHAYWFPLVLFGLLTCASMPFYILPGNHDGMSQGEPQLVALGGFPGLTVQRFLGYYWLAALLGGLLLTLVWYRSNARRVGLATPARGYIVTTTVLTILALVIPLLSQVRSPHQLSWLQHLHVLWPDDLVARGAFPFVIIAAGLLVLARAERSAALAVIAAVYTAVALLSSLYDIENVLFGLGWNPPGNGWNLTALPNVLLPAFVLLAAGVGAFTVQRYQQTRT